MNTDICIVGCGYIGQLLAIKLKNKNLNTLAYVRTDASLSICEQQGITVRQIDLDSFPCDVTVKNKNVIYLVPPQPKGDADLRIKNFLDSIKSEVPDKIVLISTTGVYGDCAGQWVDENTPLKPSVARAKRRADAERQLVSFCKSYNIPWVVLRVPGIYGPGKLPVKRISSGEAIVREQDSPYSNRIHAHDLVRICIEALMSENIEGVYNCSDGHPTTMYDYFIKVADALQLKHPPTISLQQAQAELSSGMLSYMAESRRISNKKMLNDFDLKIQYPDLESGLKSSDDIQ